MRPLLASPIQAKERVSPLATSQCVALIGIRCYSPAQFENAYNLAALHAAGIDGSGETIAIVDSFGSPTIAADLHTFDQIFGVSNPYGVPIDPRSRRTLSCRSSSRPARCRPSTRPTATWSAGRRRRRSTSSGRT